MFPAKHFRQVVGLFIYCFSLLSIAALGQPVNSFINDAVMPAPNTAALGKYGDIPIGYFTGVPDINIPIYTIQEGPLSLPVSLNYHASGVKVGEMASWVGMGWTLSAGGMITRTVLGYPDEKSPYGYYVNGANLNNEPQEIIAILQGDQLDTEPDIFSFNFPGYSGKFYFDKNHDCQLIPKQDLQILWTGTFDQFTILTPDGIRYIFGKHPVSNALIVDKTLVQDEPFETVSTWHLVRIESYDRYFKIDLNYVDEYFGYRQLASCKYEVLQCLGQGGTNNTVHIDCSSSTGIIDGNHYTIKTNVAGKRLSNITCSTSTLNFLGNNIREDLESHINHSNSAKRLDKIEINSGAYCSNFILSYDYFQDMRFLNSFELFSLSESKRLKLMHAQEVSCDNSEIKPPYVFTYEGETMTQIINGVSVTRQFLPHRLSKEIDHWGYFNNKTGNEFFLVNVPETTITLQNGLEVTYGEANRNPDESAMKKGVLKQIDYPMGGYTSFVFEANKYDKEDIELTDPWKVENYHYPDPNHVCGSTQVESVHTFSASTLPNTVYKLSLTYPAQGCSNAGSTVYMSVEAFNEITGNFIGEVGFNIEAIPGNYESTGLIPINPFGIGIIPADTPIRFVLHSQDGWAKFETFTSKLIHTQVDAGGLRIKKIVTHDGINSDNDIIKTYEYTDETDNTKSSGVVLTQPKYGFVSEVFTTAGQVPDINLVEINYFSFNSESIVPLGGYDGIEIAYKHVVEYHNGNGKTSYNYFILTNNPPLLHPVPPPTYFSLNGKLERSINYIEDGTEVSYEQNNSGGALISLSAGTIYKYIRRPDACLGYEGNPGPKPALFKTDYNIRADTYRVYSRVLKKDEVTTNISYGYDPINRHLLPTSETVTNSDNKNVKTEYHYPINLENTCLRDELVDRNIIGIPTSTRTYVNNTLVNADSIRWTNFSETTGMPNATCTGNGNNPNSPYPWKFYSYELALDDNNSPIGQGQWVEKGEIKERFPDSGLPKTFALKPSEADNPSNPNVWAIEEYKWEVNGLIKERKYEDFIWQYGYHDGTRLLSSITDIDGQTVSFEYDQLMRLEETSARNGKVKTTYTYHYGNPEEWQGGNKITSRTIYDDEGEENDFADQVTFQHFDGLGRPLDTWRIGYGPQHQNIVAEKIFYDNQGRVEQKSYMPDIKGGLTYTTFDYEKSPLNRLLSETYPDGESVKSAYGNEGNYYLTTVTDENEHNTSTLTDILGRKTEVRGELSTVTKFIYDDKNNLKKVINPENQEYRYTYDARNRLTQKTVPGADCQDFYYDDRDLLVASRDGNLYNNGGSWIVNNYDIYGRVSRTGFGSPSPGVSFAPCGGTLPAGLQFSISDELITNTYDAQGSSSCPASYTPKGKLGRTTVRVINSDGTLGSSLATEYCYDQYGRVEKTESDLYEAGSDIHNTTYDIADHVKNITRLYNNEFTVQENFTFDHGGRVLNQSHSIPGTIGASGLAVMQYNTKDQLTDKLIGGLAGMTYQYNTRGWLTHINHMPFNYAVPTATCQGPPPPGGGNDDTAKCGECGDDLLNIEQILNLRFKKNLTVDCYISCDCNRRCTPALVQPCSDTTGTGGSVTVSTTGLKYPSWLYEIEKCTGQNDQVLEKDMPYVAETYAVKSRILLENADQQFKVETTEGDQTVDLPGLIGLINQGGEVNVKTGRKEFCLECETGLPGCSPQDSMAQLSSLAALSANLIHDISGLQLPTNLIRIRLCNGREIYLFEEEFQYLAGGFIVLQVIEITDSAQRLVLESDTGGETNVYVSYYLQTRDLGPGWIINYYRPCENNECATLDEIHYAKSVGASTIFSTYDNAAPYQNLTQTSPHSVNSLVRDGQNWNINLSLANGEAEWQAGVYLSPDAVVQSYSAVVYIPSMRVNNAKIGLYDGTQFVKINGNQDFILLNDETFPQMPFLRLTPDQLPSATQIQNMKVAIYVGSKNIVIDAVYVELDYMHPCDRCTQQDPVCTPEEQTAQLASLVSIKELAKNLPVSEIPMPTNLYRVKLCNGDEIYLLQHELALLQGDYIILQSITVNNLKTTYTTNVSSTIPTTFTGPPPPRYDLFALKLEYYSNDALIYGISDGYGNGNIATMYWQISGRDRQAYSLQYDELDRLKNGYYAEIPKNGPYYNKGNYNENYISYDKIGNIKTLIRNGAVSTCEENGQFSFDYGAIDILSYKYDGSPWLKRIKDVSGVAKGFKATQPNHEYAYDYDHNGNLIYDESKGATVTYNHLNLPREITVQSSNGIDPGGIIQWTYDATGRKLKKISPDGITLYHDGIEKAGGGIFVYHAEGRVAFYPGNPSATPPVEDKWYYEFSMRDHLGNTRITFADLNGDGYIQANPGDWIFNDPHGSPVGYTEILQENHYYPFGMNMEGPWREPEVEAKVNRYQYNGYEHNSDLGLGWYDYGWRSLDPATCRWNAIDPHGENYLAWSSYHYAANNPVGVMDIAGLDWYKNNETGKYEWFKGSDDIDGYTNVGEYYIHVGENDIIVHRQNEIIRTFSSESTNPADILVAGDNAFTKQELFAAADQNENIAKWLYSQGSMDLQQEYAGHRRTEAMYDAMPAYAAVAAPLALIAGAELAAVASIGVGITSTSSGYGGLSIAGNYGIKTYNSLRALVQGQGYQVHHLIEKRFAALMGQSPGNMLSVVVTKAEHQIFTNAWRSFIPYGQGTANATRTQILNAAKQIYKNYPAILKALGL